MCLNLLRQATNICLRIVPIMIEPKFIVSYGVPPVDVFILSTFCIILRVGVSFPLSLARLLVCIMSCVLFFIFCFLLFGLVLFGQMPFCVSLYVCFCWWSLCFFQLVGLSCCYGDVDHHVPDFCFEDCELRGDLSIPESCTSRDCWETFMERWWDSVLSSNMLEGLALPKFVSFVSGYVLFLTVDACSGIIFYTKLCYGAPCENGAQEFSLGRGE